MIHARKPLEISIQKALFNVPRLAAPAKQREFVLLRWEALSLVQLHCPLSSIFLLLSLSCDKRLLAFAFFAFDR